MSVVGKPGAGRGHLRRGLCCLAGVLGLLVLPRPATAGPTIRMVTVDSDSYTGYENAIYAVDKDTLIVAYKRFLSDPIEPTGAHIPAELRVARSIDGGKTWSVKVIDPQAIEIGDEFEQSVSIDGDHASTIYIAYLVSSSGAFADLSLHVAKSIDTGATWTLSTLGSFVGVYNSIRVLDANNVLISASGEGPSVGLHVFSTSNGGTTWTDALVDGSGERWYTGIDGTASGKVYVSHYWPSVPVKLHLAKFRPAKGTWKTTPIDQAQGYTGLGDAIALSGGALHVSYEDFSGSISILKVATSTDGGTSWSIVPVEQAVYVGSNTSVHTVGSARVFVSYWHANAQTLKGKPRLATSADGGATWSILTVPERQNVDLYIDLAAPAAAVQFISYQTRNFDTDASTLRVARIAQGA
jgi:hypothetical protein